MANNKFAIVIPVYSLHLKSYQICVLDYLISICKEFQIIIIHPRSFELDIDNAEILVRYGFHHIAFDDSYFKNIESYNRLCLSYSFYNCFSDFDYIIIHQLDAFLFRNELNYWLDKNYDYVAPPWVGVDVFKFIRGTFENNVPLLLKAKVLPLHKALFGHDFLVGNGGISLRKVKTFKRVLKLYNKQARNWPYNEDLFYSLFIPAHYPFFRIPSFNKSLAFGFDLNPLEAFEMNKNELPMAAHGFDKPNYFLQWKEIMARSPHIVFQEVLKSIENE
ncbi:DUF5672 family protein [Peijinzhouia sedimentorum]